MSKFYIVPKSGTEISIDADSKDDAIINFATTMDTDMSIYFEALTKEELDAKRAEADSDAHERHVIAFMKETLMTDFNIDDEDTAEMLAENAYDIYCEGDGQTEYESIEEAYNEWKNK